MTIPDQILAALRLRLKREHAHLEGNVAAVIFIDADDCKTMVVNTHRACADDLHQIMLESLECDECATQCVACRVVVDSAEIANGVLKSPMCGDCVQP